MTKVRGNFFQRRTNTLKKEVQATENYVRLDFLKSYAGEILANFLTKLILDELK
jgi:hypothetical protein